MLFVFKPSFLIKPYGGILFRVLNDIQFVDVRDNSRIRVARECGERADIRPPQLIMKLRAEVLGIS